MGGKKLKTKKQKFKVRNLEKEAILTLEKNKLSLGKIDPESVKSFDEFPICQKTLKGLKEEKFKEPTKVQRQSLIHSLAGLDVVAAAKTGSGKTLAFIIPLLENLYSKHWSPLDGLGALIITPTRELSYQILEVINKVGKHHNFSVGLIIGGKDLKFEWSRVGTCNIMICTPGRILQHMTENPNFNCENLQMLILDEADQCLSLGFADTMNTILEDLPIDRQTLLFSATQTRDVKDLIRAGCKDPVFCSVHEHSKTSTPKTLTESYVVCEDHEKLMFIYSFLRHHLRKKILIFLSTCKQVKYYFDIFCKLQPGLSILGLHGDMHQLRRMAVYDEFCSKKHSALFATDVAARGLDIPLVDWVVQIDCPEDVTAYIHRAGRTARHVNEGNSLLVLTPSQEMPMVTSLQKTNIPIEKIDVDPNRLQNVERKIGSILAKYVNLKEEAVRAFKTYIKHLALMKNKKVFDVTSVNLELFAKSLGLLETPRVRFLERKLKATEKIKERAKNKIYQNDTEKNKEEEDIFDFQTILPDDYSHKKELPADSLLKTQIKLNNRIIFDEEREANTEDVKCSPSKNVVSYNNESLMTEFIEIAKAKREADDDLDKKEHKEKVKAKHKKEKLKEKKNKLKEKEVAESESDFEESFDDEDNFDMETQNIIDDLPDPEELYGDNSHFDSDSKSDRSEGRDSDFEAGSPNIIKSGKRQANSPLKQSKKKMRKTASTSDVSSLALNDKEALALYLLKGTR